MVVAGWVLIGLGLLFLAVSLVAAAREELSKKTLEASKAEGALTALAAVLAELAKLPKWLAMAVIGIALVVAGTLMVSGEIGMLMADAASPTPAAEAPAENK